MEREKGHTEYTKLGNTGMDISRICLGCMGFGDAEHWFHKWVLNEEDSRPIIKENQCVHVIGVHSFLASFAFSLQFGQSPNCREKAKDARKE